ncbi:Pentapeptide repeat-containing protein [Friedmanniella luteola]|uniref:Pentapeptide repeat-containing protein n=1 Tax=Friedmanniella luteola TaxID=546871 RepID=A0A1H2A2Z1_9ACTN|nr:pentapeptide repeat-containing protein [Friedmanniella luteola]SDT40243.1 Pentapeptide repeat-containing protein [Friedmanniella luteola]
MVDATTDESDRSRSVRADCASCAGLCCVALAFGTESGFGYDKEAGDPCVNLQPDHRCGIHAELRPRGFSGCTVFDCQGTGQKVTQVTFGGRSWQQMDPAGRELMFITFQVMRPLHDLLWVLDEALGRPETRSLHAELEALFAETEAMTLRDADGVLGTDVQAQRRRAADVIARASELVRAQARGRRRPSRAARRAIPDASLLGADLAEQDLRGVDLSGALLIRADLRAVDLGGADLRSADLRDADLSGAHLADALFLTQFQVNSADGDEDTELPPRLTRPDHWSGPRGGRRRLTLLQV